MRPPGAGKAADVIMVVVPDELAGELYERDIAPGLRDGKYLAFLSARNEGKSARDESGVAGGAGRRAPGARGSSKPHRAVRLA